MYKKFLILFLLIFILFSCAVDNSQKNPPDTTAADISEETTELNYYRNIPAGTNFDGYTFNILQYNHTQWIIYTEIDEFNGEVLNDAAYTRNLEVCGMLGIEINVMKNSNVISAMNKSNAAGDNAYDLVIPWIADAVPSAMVDNQLYVWNKIPVIELKAPWYNQSANDVFNVNGKQYLAVSSLTYTIQQHLRYLFNKELFVDLGLDYPYQLVYDGKWTYDALYKYVHDSYADLNGDGVKDKDDRFGLSGFEVEIAYSIINWGEFAVYMGNDGFTLNIFSERISTMIDKLRAMVFSNDYLSDSKAPSGTRNFFNGNVLIAGYSSDPALLRDIEFDFGYLPFPKYDELQQDYITRSNGGFMAVPISKPESELERLGTIIEAMSASSYKYVNDAFVRHYMEGKVLRDEDSVNMYRICRRTETYNRAYFFDTTEVIRNLAYYTEFLTNSSLSMASQYEKNAAKIEQALQNIYESIINNENN
ncbi:MAG: hypothetical protein FWF15_02950 [Oscillospiraceae bacterium]|nr:hypothetical protein [Oscillospiraceae bacterium]